MSVPKPILKWVGGKTQIIDEIMAEFPTEMNNYHEIFLGGCSVLLALLTRIKNGTIKVRGNIYAYDINEALIYIYKNIQLNHEELHAELRKLIDAYQSCSTEGETNRAAKNIEEAKTTKESYYYWIRGEYNKTQNKKTSFASAMFIFLNKTCFRGLFRVGPNGFNVPYGNYKNPEIINKKHLDEIHDLIQNVIFTCADFTTSMRKVEAGDYVYLDPPYVPETNNSFVKYTENGFDAENHKMLFNLIHEITNTRDIKILLSNADVNVVRTAFADKKYKIKSITCKRKINSTKPNAKTQELLIKNY